MRDIAGNPMDLEPLLGLLVDALLNEGVQVRFQTEAPAANMKTSDSVRADEPIDRWPGDVQVFTGSFDTQSRFSDGLSLKGELPGQPFDFVSRQKPVPA